MKLDDFGKIEALLESEPIEVSVITAGIKSYIADKLREFGEGLKKPNLDEQYSILGKEIAVGWNKRNSELNAQIDKELSELQ